MADTGQPRERTLVGLWGEQETVEVEGHKNSRKSQIVSLCVSQTAASTKRTRDPVLRCGPSTSRGKQLPD